MDGPATPSISGLPREAHAGLVSRLVGLGLDVLVVTILAAFIMGLALGGAEVVLGEIPDWIRLPIGVAVGVLPVTYFTAAWWLIGQTLGGMVMGIAVCDVAGHRLRFPRSLIRAFIGLSLAPLWLVGMVLVLVDRRRRGLLDIVVGTVVLYVPDRYSRGAGRDEAFTHEG